MASSTHSPTPHGALARITHRAARIAGRRPKTMIVLWLVIVAGCLFAGAHTGTRQLTDTQSAVGQTHRALARLDAAHLATPNQETFLIRAANPSAARATAAGLERRLRAAHLISTVAHPLPSADGGRALLVVANLHGHFDSPEDLAVPVAQRVTTTLHAHPGSTIQEAGDASINHTFNQYLSAGLGHASMISLPLTLIILAIAFGAIVAACVPLVLGITAVAGAFGALGLVSQIVPAGGSTQTVVALIGLAVGVDYSLFYIRREREERRAGRSAEAALTAAGATVGRAVVMAGLTVMLSVGGLLLTRMAVFESMALGTIVVVVLAVIGSLTVLPAVLALLGDRVNKGRVRRAARDSRSRVWGGVARGVTRHPVMSLLTASALLVALAIPALHMHTASPDLTDLPQSAAVVRAADAIGAAFQSTPATAQVVVEGRELGTSRAHAALVALGEGAARASHGAGPVDVAVSRDGRTARVDVPMPPGGVAIQRAAITRVRAEVIPAAAQLHSGGASLRALVGGGAADSADFTSRLQATTPIVIGAVLAVAMVLVLAGFGSPLLALGVMALNLLSIGATYGVITKVFQDHSPWAQHALHFTSSGSITDWLPLFAFVVLFGLSMDYTILILERVREARSRGLSAREAAIDAIAATGGVVTSAALVMVAVFAPYATGHLLSLKELGVGVAFSILLDATVVRGLALPALIAAIGDRGWRVPVTSPVKERWNDETRERHAVAA